MLFKLLSLSSNTMMVTKRNVIRGFTLIEMIIGLLVFAIALSLVTTLLIPAEENSVDQLHQVKAAQLAKALLNDILNRSFDENSDRDGGIYRCGEDKDRDGTTDLITENCTSEANFGTDIGENTRSDYDDVDDFNGFSTLVTATDTALDTSYSAFQLSVSVEYAGIEINSASNLSAKRITVNVTTPLNTSIQFSAYKGNY